MGYDFFGVGTMMEGEQATGTPSINEYDPQIVDTLVDQRTISLKVKRVSLNNSNVLFSLF